MFKNIRSILLLLMLIPNVQAQQSVTFEQQQISWLKQYVGTWLTQGDSSIKMTVEAPMDNALVVKVYRKEASKWVCFLVELISFDAISQQIVAAGADDNNQAFIGKGKFLNQHTWMMQDVNHLGDKTMQVTFNFVSDTQVNLTAISNIPANNWKITYAKQAE